MDNLNYKIVPLKCQEMYKLGSIMYKLGSIMKIVSYCSDPMSFT